MKRHFAIIVTVVVTFVAIGTSVFAVRRWSNGGAARSKLSPTTDVLHSTAVFASPDPGYSNIYPGDYVGPEVCGQCHKKNYRLWRTHPHSRMNQDADGSSILGDFSDREIVYGGNRVVFGRDGTDHTVTIFEDDRVFRRFKVTRTVGSRFIQFYIGLQTKGPEPPEAPCYTVEFKLFFAYSLKLNRWLPALYFASADFPEYGESFSYADFIYHHPKLQTWNEHCVSCHNTYPYVYRFGVPGLTGFPDKRIRFDRSKLPPEVLTQTGKIKPPLPDAFVTIGISCESCHFGGREHAINGKPICFYPTSPDLVITRPETGSDLRGRKNPFLVNSICFQCHNSDVALYPNGASRQNAAEAIDLRRGACRGAVKCTDCHNPHRPGVPGGSLPRQEHIDACLKCHGQFKSPTVLADHTQHSPQSGVTCLDCHMPKIVQGLETAVRTHYISSPTDTRMLAVAAPNACNLCHLDRSLNWTLKALESGWGRRITPQSQWARAYGGSLAAPVGPVWLNSPVHQVRLVATQAYADSDLGQKELASLLRSLNDSYAANCMFGLFAVEKVLGRRLDDAEYDLLGSPEKRHMQIEALLERLVPAS